jgi:hypothetical protein
MTTYIIEHLNARRYFKGTRTTTTRGYNYEEVTWTSAVTKAKRFTSMTEGICEAIRLDIHQAVEVRPYEVIHA